MPGDRLRPQNAPRATRERTIKRYSSEHGAFEAVLDHQAGATTISRDGATQLVARWAPTHRLSIRDGIALELSVRPGRVHRPSYGLVAERRRLLIEAEDRTWTARVRWPARIVLERGGAPLAQHRFGAVTLTPEAGPDDATITVLLTALDLWPKTKLWTAPLQAF